MQEYGTVFLPLLSADLTAALSDPLPSAAITAALSAPVLCEPRRLRRWLGRV